MIFLTSTLAYPFIVSLLRYCICNHFEERQSQNRLPDIQSLVNFLTVLQRYSLTQMQKLFHRYVNCGEPPYNTLISLCLGGNLSQLPRSSKFSDFRRQSTTITFLDQQKSLTTFYILSLSIYLKISVNNTCHMYI